MTSLRNRIMSFIARNLSLPLALTAFACPNLHASESVVTNLNGSTTSRDNIAAGYANAFTTGGDDAILDSVTLYLKVNAADSAFTLGIYDDNAGTVGNPLCTASLSGITSGSKSLSFSGFTGTTTLAASNTYWVVITADDNINSSSSWYDADTSSSSTRGWQINSSPKYYALSSWWNAMDSDAQQMSINATVVPEPAETAATFAIAATLLLWARRKSAC
jgi:hypothetical protein